MDLGISRIEDIPDDFKLTENQIKVRNAVKSGQPIIKDGLREALNQVSFPAYHLDFETINTAIPLYSDIAPFTQIPVEYSVHKCSAPGQVIEHFKYLADPTKDCRRDLAESLIDDCGTKGTIFSYSSSRILDTQKKQLLGQPPGTQILSDCIFILFLHNHL